MIRRALIRALRRMTGRRYSDSTRIRTLEVDLGLRAPPTFTEMADELEALLNDGSRMEELLISGGFEDFLRQYRELLGGNFT